MPDLDSEEFQTQLVAVLDAAYATAYHFTRDETAAADLVQDASLLAWRGFHSFQHGTSFRAWFMRILTNRFLSDYRRDKRRGMPVDIDEVPEAYLFNRTEAAGWHAATEDPASALLGRLDVAQIAAAMDRLPEEFRVVSTLYFMDDLSYQEIADIVGVPVGTVRSRLHRARKMLQRELWSVAEELGITTTPTGSGDEV